MIKKIIPVVLYTVVSLLAINGFAQQTKTRTTKSQNSSNSSSSNNSKLTGTIPGHIVFDTAEIKMITKEIIHEVVADKGATIKITNSIRNLEVRPWAESKVKIVTTVSVEEKLAGNYSTIESLMEAAGISIRSFGNRVDLQARSLNRLEARSVNGGPLMSFDYVPAQSADKTYTLKNLVPTTAETELREQMLANQHKFAGEYNNFWSSTGRIVKTMIVFVPEDSKLDIDNRNTDILINANIGNAHLKLSHSNLDARNFKHLSIIADYYNINISDVEEAELELRNGTFMAGVMTAVDLDSENSEIEYSSGSSLYMRSQGDRMMIDEISKVDGRKLYGELRIGKLLSSIDIEGTNADIKIRNIHQIVEKVRISDKYADLRLPVKSLKNFTVDFQGENSTVFANFEKTPLAYNKPEEKTSTKSKAQDLVLTNPDTAEKLYIQQQKDWEAAALFDRVMTTHNATRALMGEKAPVKFTAKEGDTSGKHTKFEIVCHQCSVDFK